MLLMIYVGVTFGSFVLKNVPIKECVFISACLSLSSTPLVMKFLQPADKSKVGHCYEFIVLTRLFCSAWAQTHVTQ